MTVEAAGDGGGGLTPVVAIRLGAGAGPHLRGRPVPIMVEVLNQSEHDLWMVGVVDGSEDGARYPHYRPTVTRGGDVVASPPPPEDPLVGPLRAKDFRRLGPGRAFDPTLGDGGAAYLPLSTFATFAPTEPGVYRYSLVLSTESGRPEDWLGRFGQDEGLSDVLELIGRVPRLTVTSNAVDVEIS